MHIVIVIPNISVIGGTTRVVATLANYWVSQKYQVTIITFVTYKKTYYQLDSRINIIIANLVEATTGIIGCCYYNIKRIFKLRKLINQLKPNVVLSIGAIVNILLAIALPYKRNYLVVATEHIYPPNKGLNILLRLLQKHKYKYLDATVALTDETNRWLCKYTNAKNIATIANPINYPLKNHNPIVETTNIINKGKKTLLFVGELIERKGINLLIDIFAKLNNKYSDWHLVVLGDGKLKQQLTAQIQQLKLANKIYLLGPAGNVGEWYEIADLFVFPSLYEGFGCVLAEAMCYGLPAVSFDCKSGPSDIITHGVDGFLVEDRNTEKLKQALSQLMSDEKLRHKFALNAIDVRERFSAEKIGNKWNKLFAELVNQN